MKTARAWWMLLLLIIPAIIMSILLSQNSRQTAKSDVHKVKNDEQYTAAVEFISQEAVLFNQQYVGHLIHKNTRLDSVVMNEGNKRLTYQLTLTDISERNIQHVSAQKKMDIIKGEKAGLVAKLKNDTHLTLLFEHGWSMEYIQKTNDDTVLSDIIITGDDMAEGNTGHHGMI
ncbi:hypothetical protein [Dryocola clanedunensis]|uniref:hypothetical protein n=1 Tax=Cedecea sulfonylureivorans TaxID=3051154 RepID=UPI00192679E5|nr:hypothetical protein [Cedecea sulfonylureivorans]